MKTRLLLIIVFALVPFVFPNADAICTDELGWWESCNDSVKTVDEYIGGGAIDMDPDLSPTYAYDFMGGLFYHTILPITGWVVGISALFLVPYFILKRKNIPSKPYLSIILAVLLLFFALPNFIASLQTLAMIFSAQPENMIIWVFDPQFVVLLIPIIVLIIAGILLYRSTVIRKLLKR